jgi:hypothetical protein
MNSKYFKITVPGAIQNITGVVSAAALIGAPVMVAPSATTVDSVANNGTKLSAHGGVFGGIYFLNRPVVASIDKVDIYENNGDVLPYKTGSIASAVTAREIEVESGNTAGDGLAAYLDASLNGAEAAGTRLTFLSGKWAEYSDAAAHGVCGRLVGWLTPVDAGNIRALIEVYEFASQDKLV